MARLGNVVRTAQQSKSRRLSRLAGTYLCITCPQLVHSSKLSGIGFSASRLQKQGPCMCISFRSVLDERHCGFCMSPIRCHRCFIIKSSLESAELGQAYFSESLESLDGHADGPYISVKLYLLSSSQSLPTTLMPHTVYRTVSRILVSVIARCVPGRCRSG